MTIGTLTKNMCCNISNLTVNCDPSSCNWVDFMSKWIYYNFPNRKINIINLARSGMTSELMALEAYAMMAARGIVLSENDIILLDHSCNDYSDRNGIGIESLIREIYTYAIDRHSDSGEVRLLLYYEHYILISCIHSRLS